MATINQISKKKYRKRKPNYRDTTLKKKKTNKKGNSEKKRNRKKTINGNY